MQVQRFWKVIGIGGLVVNLVLIIIILSQSSEHRPPHPHGPGGPKLYIIDFLKLDNSQIQRYEKMVDNDRKFVSANERRIRDFHRKLYTKDLDKLQMDNLLDSISFFTRSIENQRVFHMKEIKSLCETEEQKQLFEKLSRQLPELFSPKKSKPENHKKH